MAKFDELADKLYQMFNTYEYDFKMYDKDGNGVMNPFVARYFYIKEPNFMVIIDDDTNNIEVHKAPIDMDLFKKIFKSISSICRYHAVKLDIKNYNSKITPKDYSPQIEKRQYKKERQESILETAYDSRTVNSISFTESNETYTLNYFNIVSKNSLDKYLKSSIIKPLTITTEGKTFNVSSLTFEEACDKLLSLNLIETASKLDTNIFTNKSK